jgi:hypothetical protein
VVEFSGQRPQLFERPLVIVASPGASRPLLHRWPVTLGEVIQNVSLFVTDTGLHGHRPEHLVDRLPERLGAIDHT